MKLVRLNEIFDVKYGVNLELNKLKLCSKHDNKCIPFVSRTEKNNGVSAFVEIIDTIIPNPSNTISVAGGGSVLSSFYQENSYYSGRDLYILTPKMHLSKQQLLLYCTFISANKYRYNYGRQANKTLGNIKLPAPRELGKFSNIQIPNKPTKQPYPNKQVSLNDREWQYVKLIDYFNMCAGKYYDDYNTGNIPLVSSADSDNGVMKFTNIEAKFNNKSITIGKVGCSTYYQNHPFIASPDVTVLEPKFNNFNSFIGMFIVAIISQEKFKWSYGRQIRIGDSKKLRVKLPTTNKEPDWQFMEDYIKSLPYSANL